MSPLEGYELADFQNWLEDETCRECPYSGTCPYVNNVEDKEE